MNLNRLLNPRSVAIVGASGDTTKLSGMILNFLGKSGYPGEVYPINPKYSRIGDYDCYPSVDALTSTVDLMVCVVPVAAAFDAIEAAARRGVPYCLLMTGGFGEGRSGDEGRDRLARLKRICEETGMRVVGPNTVGMVNFRQGLPLTFADWYGRDTGARDGVAIVTHSGSIGGLIFSALQLNQIGVNYWIGVGNEATLETADFINHFSDDPDVHTVICYMEGVGDGRKFIAACEKARASGTRIIVLKAGQFPETVRSTLAHTAKQPSLHDVYAGVLKQYGVVQVASLAELNYAMALLTALGDQLGPRVGVISASGGACSVIADHVIQAGLQLPELPNSLQGALDEAIPIYGASSNPIDLSADVVARGEILDRTLEALSEDDSINVWMLFGRPLIDRYYPKLIEFVQRTGKAMIACTGVPTSSEVHNALHSNGIAVLADPELCLRALACIANVPVEHRQPEYRPSYSADNVSGPEFLESTVEQPLLRAEVRQDPDFGAVLVANWEPSYSGRGDQVVRALPVQGRDLSSMVADLERCANESPLDAVQIYDALQTIVNYCHKHPEGQSLVLDVGYANGRVVVCASAPQGQPS